jgi:luciferase family oxidoreductase group 1
MTSPDAAAATPSSARTGLQLSVLDLIPVRAGQSTAQALRASVALAQAADRVGAARFWVAEHHNMPAVAATNPPVLIAMLAAATRRIRVGSGGVMLPNHAPLVVAEQFALLEAAYPGRIDLGIGRAPGSDPVTNWALRHGGPETADPERFGAHVSNLVAMLSPDGVGLTVQGDVYPLRATPRAVGVPEVWLLGSSDFSARLAAEHGLPYVFAHHFSGRGTAEALRLYRSKFQPSEHLAEPKTLLTVNVAVGETRADAIRATRPQLLAMVALRTRGTFDPLATVEEAERTELPAVHQPLAAEMISRWVLGPPTEVAEQLRALADTFAVDEVMINPIAGAHEADPLDRTPSRERTIEGVVDALRPASGARLGDHP